MGVQADPVALTRERRELAEQLGEIDVDAARCEIDTDECIGGRVVVIIDQLVRVTEHFVERLGQFVGGAASL